MEHHWKRDKKIKKICGANLTSWLLGPKQDDHKATNLETRNKQNGLQTNNHESQTMTFWTRASKHMFPKRSAKMIEGTENLKFAKCTAWYKEFRCESQTVGTALNVKRSYK